MPVKVLVVDDSALIRRLLSEILSADPGIEVVGTASDPYVARAKIKALRPDVLTLDVEMPRMDGLRFLEHLMRLHPLPVVMVSTLTERGADVALAALALGAVDFLAKPELDVARGLHDYADTLREKVRGAARARPAARAQAGTLPAVLPQGYRGSDRLIALGASAGGTEALRAVVERMPADAPALVMAQHIPAGFSRAFAERLDRSSSMIIREAEDGQAIVPGCGYLAPGGRHLEVVRSGARWLCRLGAGPPVNRHRPSVDVLFASVLAASGRNAVAGLLTGMGDDGARGLLALHRAGVRTLVQDEASSVVWGMPGAAFRLGAADEVVELERIAERLLALAAG